MLDKVKLALRISGDTFDEELTDLIAACVEEMTGLGVIIDDDASGVPSSAQVRAAIIAYCKWQFGDNNNKEQFEAIYHTHLAQLKTMDTYTDWSGGLYG